MYLGSNNNDDGVACFTGDNSFCRGRMDLIYHTIGFFSGTADASRDRDPCLERRPFGEQRAWSIEKKTWAFS